MQLAEDPALVVQRILSNEGTNAQQCKGASKRVLEFPFIEQIADDPATILQRKKSNDSTNARKKEQIAAGQEKLAEQEANGEGTAPAKKPRAPRKRKDSDDDSSEAPASKQIRT